MTKIFKVHTDELGRLIDCLRKSMYGVSKSAFLQQLPNDLRNASVGDIVFISEKNVSGGALFGPLYIVNNAPGIATFKQHGTWVEIDTKKSDPKALAYWVEMEKRNFCLLFDRVLIDKISVVWPQDWLKLGLQLPSWGLVNDENASKLIDFALRNEQEAKDFFSKHQFVLN